MADVLFPDVANAFLKAQAVNSNALQDRLLTTRANREETAYKNRQGALGMIGSNDPQAAQKAFSLDPQIGMQIQQFRAAGRKNELEDMQARVEHAAKAGMGVLSAPPEHRPSLYAQERARLLRAFPDMQMPEQYDEGFVRSAVQRAQSVSDYFSQPMVGGQPISQMRPQQPRATAPVTDRIVAAEYGDGSVFKNPNSSASGVGQFIDSTWLSTVKAARPDLAQGRSDPEILAMRRDDDLSKEMVAAYAQQNGQALSQAGLPVTPGTTYLAHFAGPQGAMAVLQANPNTPVGQILGPRVVAANPFLRNMTAGQLAAWADSKMGGAETSPTRMADASGGMVPPASVASLPPSAMSPGPMGAPMAPSNPQFTTPPPAPAPQPITIKGKPYTEGAPPGYQWGMGPDGQYTAMQIPGVTEKDTAEVVDPSSPTGVRVVPKSKSVGAIPASSRKDQNADKSKLADDFRADKNIQKYQEVATLIQSARDAVKRPPGGAADLNIIYAMGKIFDPGSVVREAEMIMGRKVGGPVEAMNVLVDYVKTGGFLSQPVRDKILIELESRTSKLKKSHDAAKGFYERRAKALGIDPDEVLYDVQPAASAADPLGIR